MAEPRRENPDPIEALERLRDTTLPSSTPSRESSAGAGGPAADSRRLVEARPTAPHPPPPSRPPPSSGPRYRCLGCGYPLADPAALRCTECGRAFDRATLVDWFDGEQQSRFDRVIWLVVACLFVRLLVLDPLPWVSHAGTAAVAFSACAVAYRGRGRGLGGYFAVGGMVSAVLMLVFSAFVGSLAFYTLDVVAGCVLLLAMLDEAGGPVGASGGRRALALAALFASPILALGAQILDQGIGAVLAASWPFLQKHPLFSTILPHLAAAAVWLFVWRSLAHVRKILFQPVLE